MVTTDAILSRQFMTEAEIDVMIARLQKPRRSARLHAYGQTMRSGSCENLSYELHKHVHLLGPKPRRSLEVFVDLGLSDAEIARYFRLEEQHVTGLRLVWDIQAQS